MKLEWKKSVAPQGALDGVHDPQRAIAEGTAAHSTQIDLDALSPLRRQGGTHGQGGLKGGG